MTSNPHQTNTPLSQLTSAETAASHPSGTSNPQLYVSPISREIVRLAMEWSHDRKTPIGFCASTNQINVRGGYAEGWTPATFKGFVTGLKAGPFPDARYKVEWDHAGRLQATQDAFNQLDACIAAGWDGVHLDGFTDRLSAPAALTLQANGLYWVIGGGENPDRDICRDYQHTAVYGARSIALPLGHRVRGSRNVGKLDAKLLLEAMNYNLPLRVHNADWIDGEERDRLRQAHHLFEAVNIGPMLGTIQTQQYHMLYSGDWASQVVDAGEWRKWFDKPDLAPHVERMWAGGHYHFGLLDREMLNKTVWHDLRRVMFRVFDFYMEIFN